MHKCRVPLSMEVAYSYFSDRYDYNDVIAMEEELDDMFSEFEGSNELLDTSIDYYYPRTYFIAEAILKYSSSALLRKVMCNVVYNVPKYLIYNYKTFRKNAFDSVLTGRAFSDWNEGKRFYEFAYLYDNENPYVLQQGALFLAKKNKYSEAFRWIDKAINSTNDKFFSIRNSHAIILFDANYELPLDVMVENNWIVAWKYFINVIMMMHEKYSMLLFMLIKLSGIIGRLIVPKLLITYDKLKLG